MEYLYLLKILDGNKAASPIHSGWVAAQLIDKGGSHVCVILSDGRQSRIKASIADICAAFPHAERLSRSLAINPKTIDRASAYSVEWTYRGKRRAFNFRDG